MTRQARFTTILFDLDGTLIDSLDDIAEAANRVLLSFGYPDHPADRFRHFVGDGLMTLARRIVPEHTAEDRINQIAWEFRQQYEDSWNRKSRPYNGIDNMLDHLSRHGVKLAVLSNKPDDFTQRYVAAFFPDVAFGLVFGNREGVPKKPDPQAAIEIAEYFDSDPRTCLMVGDTSVDVLTAKAAGMMSMGVTWGFRDRFELERSGADIIIDKPEELLGHVFIDR